MKLIVFLLGCLALAGCKLVDQTTFAPAPEANPAMPATPVVDPRRPLLTIGYDTPNPHYQQLLEYAVHAAESRAPGVEYDVIAMLPAGGDAALAQRDAAEVMRSIMAQRVPEQRIHLGLRTELANSPRQVRIYVH